MLFRSVTQQHRYGDRHLYGGLSRFITPEVQALCERVASAAATAPLVTFPAANIDPKCLNFDLGQGLRRLWD